MRVVTWQGDLGFSVTIFIVCSLSCLGVLTLRRFAFGYELGGKMRWLTFVFFVLLWFLYVTLSSLKTYAVI